MKRSAITVFACILALIASGCVMPKDFEARLDVRKDGGYAFAYDGSIVVLGMLADLQKGVMNEEDEKKISTDLIAEIQKDKNISDVSYLGKAVFKLTYKAEGNFDDEPMMMGMKEMPICTLEKSPDGSVVVFRFLPDADEIREADDFPEGSRSPKGTIVVTSELEVTSTAGDPDKSPTANTYTWSIDGMDGEMPEIIMQAENE